MTRKVDTDIGFETHPCFNEEARWRFARMHIPVAPNCNIQCKYCDRRFDCMNESRPGVTSEVLSPEQAVEKIRNVRKRIPYLSVIGIAGPGDPLANEGTFQALERMREEFQDLTLCLSTNGLSLPRYADLLQNLDVRFITVTMNAIDPDIGRLIYEFVLWEGKKLTGREAAERLIESQLEGIEQAVKLGMCVKVNTVLIPEINGRHIPEIARRAKELGACISNIIPLIPVPGTEFENMRPPTPRERRELQDLCEVDIRQMRHCRVCRSDAIGLLERDRSAEFALPRGTCDPSRAERIAMARRDSYRVAVASSEGEKVDRHFSHAKSFFTFVVERGSIIQREKVDVDTYEKLPMLGETHSRKLREVGGVLIGHDIVIATDFGDRAIDELHRHGMEAFKFTGDIIEAVRKAGDHVSLGRSQVSG